jgi:triosephosphate isomerase
MSWEEEFLGSVMAASPRKPLLAGNWKMNGTGASLHELRQLALGWRRKRLTCELLICPPLTLLAPARQLKLGKIMLGAQDCHFAAFGAYTGDISAPMLVDAGARAVILGHSERRTGHGETDSVVRAKAVAARQAGLLAIICIGETEAERRTGQTLAVLTKQLESSLPQDIAAKDIVVAYEPVWAIGSGRTPSSEDIIQVHSHIRAWLANLAGEGAEQIRILYGGSLKPDNAAAILGLANVDGALVGGASLKAADFMAIADVYAQGPAKKRPASIRVSTRAASLNGRPRKGKSTGTRRKSGKMRSR